MSRIIKNSIKLADAVTIGDSFDSPAKKKLQKKTLKETLHFKDDIDSQVVQWRERAEQHFARFEKTTESRIEESFHAGYEKGFHEGLERERLDRDDYINTYFADKFRIIETLLNEAKRKNDRAFRGLEEKLISLAVGIAEKIIYKCIETNPSIVLKTVADAMSEAINSEMIVLKVSAGDFKEINARFKQWMGMAGNAKEFRIEIDNRLLTGDCLIDTEGGIIDALVSSRLELLAEELLKINK